MSSLRELRKKIKTVKQIRQITQAMKMVAAAKLRFSQQKIIHARPYADKMNSLSIIWPQNSIMKCRMTWWIFSRSLKAILMPFWQ